MRYFVADLKSRGSVAAVDTTKADRRGVVARLMGNRGSKVPALERVTMVCVGR